MDLNILKTNCIIELEFKLSLTNLINILTVPNLMIVGIMIFQLDGVKVEQAYVDEDIIGLVLDHCSKVSQIFLVSYKGI